MKVDNLVLIGMPGAGKSTIGVILAKWSGYDFLDTDIEIQHRENCLLQEIVDKRGHHTLREIEEDVCATLNVRHRIVATGGSVVYSPLAMKNLATLGPIIWLKVDFPEIERRVHNVENRGLAKSNEQTLEDLFHERQPLYEQFAQITIDCHQKQPEEIVKEILDHEMLCG